MADVDNGRYFREIKPVDLTCAMGIATLIRVAVIQLVCRGDFKMSRVFVALVCLLSSVCVADDSATIATVLLEGDSLGDAGLVQFIENLAINDNGEWIIECNTDLANTDQDGVLVKNGDVFLQEGIIGEIDAPVNSFIDFFDSVNLNNSGNSGMNLFIDPLPSNQDSGIYFNDTLLIQESDIATAEGLSAGTPYIGFFDTKINNNDVIMILASIDDAEIASTVDRAIVLLNVQTGTQSVVALEGELLPGQTEIVEDFATGPHSSAFNDGSDVLFIAELAGNSTTDNAIYLNNTLIAQEGSASPIKGRAYEFIADRALDLNDQRDYVFRASLSGDSESDDVLIKNGEVFKQEGEPAPGGFAFTGFGSTTGPVRIGNNGKVVWFGEWDDPDTDRNSGLFVDDTLVVQSGVTEIDGLTVESVKDIQDSFAMSSDGGWVIFEAALTNGIEGVFSIELNNVRLGDVNQDGVVNLLDVSPFVDLVSTGGFLAEADVNCDGVVDLLDVAPFVQILSGG